MNLMFGNNILMSEKSLDFLWAKQQVTLNNLSNIDTPNYKARYVTFEEAYQKQLQLAASTKNTRQTRNIIEGARYTVNKKEGTSERADGNNVNADTEEVELARAGLQYQYVLNAINSDLTRLRTVITGQ